MNTKPYKGSFVDQVGRSFEEVYLLQNMSVMDIGESFLAMLPRIEREGEEILNEKLDFKKGLETLLRDGLVRSYIDPSTYEKMYSLSEKGKKYCKEKGITERTIKTLEFEQIEELVREPYEE